MDRERLDTYGVAIEESLLVHRRAMSMSLSSCPEPSTPQPTTTLRSACLATAAALGPGHSEAVYQKAVALGLQHANVSHHCEYHVPVSFEPVDGAGSFHIGSERIDVLFYDERQRVHVVELKAVAASVSPKRGAPSQAMPAAHVQLQKYVRLLHRTGVEVCTGYVVNFRQAVSLREPEAMTLEFDTYDVATRTWTFGVDVPSPTETGTSTGTEIGTLVADNKEQVASETR